MATRQFRLLLWKDYLIRKRNLVTLAGVLWATAVVTSLYIVRVNVNNKDYPTCHFPARALPSAGMIPFLQSFICSVNNECSSAEDYEEIPTFEDSKLTYLQRKFSPLLYNETVIDVAGTFPDALKLLSKLADIADDPTFLQISRNGLQVSDLFNNPPRVKRYLVSHLGMDDDVAHAVMTSQLSFQGIFNGSLERCHSLVSKTLLVTDERMMELIATKLCSLTSKDLQTILTDLLSEINFNKYMKMVGNMYYKLEGDKRLTDLADTITAVFRMTKLQSFLPAELVNIFFEEKADFSYFDLNLITKLLDLFKPTFADTDAFKTIKNVADTLVISVQYIDKILTKQVNESVVEVTGLVAEALDKDGNFKKAGRALNNAVAVFKENMGKESPIDVFSILSHLTNFIFKWLPDNQKHDVLFYSTLLTKLIESAHKVININMNIQERTYNISLRHPDGVKVLVDLPTHILAKGFDALTDAERTQIMTSRINTPGQIFCDLNRLQSFFKISKEEATSLKTQLCSDAWKSYITDLLWSFGIYEIKDNINAMASLFIQETLGKDTSKQLYTLDYDFLVLKNFTVALSRMTSRDVPEFDWMGLFNVTEESEFMKTVREKGRLGKQIMIVIHGALAKVVINQNPILSYKISPMLRDTTTLVTGINGQLDITPKDVSARMKQMYPMVIKMVLATAMNEDKTYNSLSSDSLDLMCKGVEHASMYIEIPSDVDAEAFITTLCDMSTAIEDGLRQNSTFGKAIKAISTAKHKVFDEVNWTALINGLRDLYAKLDRDYPYLFDYGTYGMDEDMKNAVADMFEEAKRFWFGQDTLSRSLHLSMKVGFRLLDLMDRGVFNITNDSWMKVKYSLQILGRPLNVVNDIVKVVAASYRNESVPTELPPTTAAALLRIIPNLPQLIIDAANIITKNNVDTEPIITVLNAEPYWPCAGSLSDVLPLSRGSGDAVRAIETMLCMDSSIKYEWRSYLQLRNVTLFNIKNYNTTSFDPHVFLKFSSAFDSLVEDTSLLIEVVKDMTAANSDVAGTWRAAGQRLVELFNSSNKDMIMVNFFAKMDTVLNQAVDVLPSTLPLNEIWMKYVKCDSLKSDEVCRAEGRITWKYSLQFISVVLQNVAEDLLTYFKETNEPDSNLLQLLGFTRRTSLYHVYEHLPEYVAVLLNSYWDFNFMSQIRRASHTEFWDCEAVLEALVPMPDGLITAADIKRTKPFVCPSIFYWLSLPRGDNTLLDLVSKPQYFLFTMEAKSLNSSFENAYNTITELASLLTDIANKKQTPITEHDLKLNTLEGKLEKLIDTVINYKINATGATYKLFNEINAKQFAAMVYLTRIVTIVNKLSTNLENVNIKDEIKASDEDMKKIEADLVVMQKLFKRKPDEIIATHFDVITDLIWNNEDNFNLTKELETICDDLRNNNISKNILAKNPRIKSQICSKMYKEIYEVIGKDLKADFEHARKSLLNLVKILQNDDTSDVSDIFEFLSQRKQLILTLRNSVEYSYELNIPIYLQYLQSSIRHYDVIVTFLSGGDWWTQLRNVYNGPFAKQLFNNLEKSFEIAEDVLTNLDKIHLVRLLRDIDVNNSEAFCQPNIMLSDYLPDSTGLMSDLKIQLCDETKTDLFMELPPLLFASQGYDTNLKLPTTIDYEELNATISSTESKLDLIVKGPETPQRPQWVTEEKLAHLKQVVLYLLSKETLTKVSFGVLSNAVDAGTLFLSNEQCTLCSQLTTWFKQLNLQVFKKQEYDNLLCHMREMTLDEMYHTLSNDFHWDMAIRELISTRNYTKYELNKSMNEFLELVKLHLLDELLAPTNKLAECLARNASRNELGNATLFVNVFWHTARLVRAQLPHLHEVEGLTELPLLQQLATHIAHNLDVLAPLDDYIQGKPLQDLDVRREVNLRLVLDPDVPLNKKLPNNDWETICNTTNCTKITDTFRRGINKTLVEKNLPVLQNQEFWSFKFVSNIMKHVEEIMMHIGRLLGVGSKLDVQGLMEGKLAAMLDFLLQVLMDDNMNAIVYSLQGLTEELHPLLGETPLELDLMALGKGLSVIHQFKNYLLEKQDLRVQVSKYITNPDSVESALNRLGINNTNFWSLAAPRVHAGHIDLRPILTSRQDYRLSNFVCSIEDMSKVIFPADLGVVTAEDVHAAIVEQFCGMSDARVKQLLPVLLSNVNFTAVIDKVKDMLLPQLYAASQLSQVEGDAVVARLPRMAALLPLVQENVAELTGTLAEQPLFHQLGNFNSVGGLLGSSQFLTHAGNMLCGKPFKTDTNRFYKAIASSQDYSGEPDRAQLDALPTDFCRGLYKDILDMEGGKIVWSLVKPLIMGKILYTPASPTVQRIMHAANASFANMIKMTELIHSFANSFSSVEELSDHRAGVEALKNIISSPALSGLRSSLIGDGQSVDINVDGLFDEFGDMKGVGNILKKGSELLHCVNLNRFVAVPDEFALTHEAVRLSRVNEFSAGIVFLNTEMRGDGPVKVEYKIRMDIENVPTTTRLKHFLWTPGPESSFLEDMRYFRGFVQIQDMIDKAIIELSRPTSRLQKRETRTEDKWAVYTQQEPYPCYTRDYFQSTVYESQALLIAFFFMMLYSVSSAVRFIVQDKETGNTMLMAVMGVRGGAHSAAWAVCAAAELAAASACVCAVLCAGGVLPRSHPPLLFALLLAFALSVLAFCYMMSKLFTSASLAAVCTAIAYLISFMPFVLILSLEAVLTSTLKLFVCLSMSSAICYSFLYVARYEAMGVGAQWSNLFDAPDGEDMSVAVGAGMALLDALIYFLIGYLLDRYFGPKTLQSNITTCKASDEKAGVSIVNVSKSYGQRLALDNVSIELHKGQITTLLGHNGAGKTTLLKILTGMLKPNKGHVIVRSEQDSGPRLGVCPQRDVLFEHLSAAEHVALYAQLKSHLPLEHLRDEIQSMMEVLSLGPQANLPVARLSGGTRRRVCVALAFVARPHLVSLDEPTSGVDPAARRDIWSMIVKLREDRTILLTTHHLDEAELLSDQIVIMHKGQIHTTGSPIEIKRSLGNGYKLTVMFPHRSANEDPWVDEDNTIEEQTKQLLAVVREVVSNASLADMNGLEVEIALPFFDTNGLNNNFLQLCTSLEARQEELGFSHYSLDCSSLEQVFFNICHQADAPNNGIEYDPDAASKSVSSSSIKSDMRPLVPAEGPLRGSRREQFLALLHARYLHYKRNAWLMFLLVGLPSLFIATAMGFSMIRPPADNEISLPLTPAIYWNSTSYLVTHPSIYSDNIDTSFAERVMNNLLFDKDARNWTAMDTPACKCGESRQECDIKPEQSTNLPEMMVVPNVSVLNDWIVASHDVYIEKRYGGFASSIKNNVTNLVAWYNNKGHHALPAYLSALSSALLRVASGHPAASIAAYAHPLKISREQLSKDTVYQHIADAGISGLVLVAYCLVCAGGAIYLVQARTSHEKRLQLLCGVSPALYWAAALTADMIILFINLLITVIVFEAFGFPVFVARNNLPAICLLIVLYGYACGAFVHVAEKLFSEASLGNMVLFCGNAFLGLLGITLLLILDIISESEKTDNARWILHKVFLICPQFVLGDGLLEIAKNTVQAQVLDRFGMDTYKDPLSTDLIAYHYLALVLVGTVLLLLNLAIEYDCFDYILNRFRSENLEDPEGESEDPEVVAERKRVLISLAQATERCHLPTIGNINAGFVETEVKKNSIKRIGVGAARRDVAALVRASKAYGAPPRHAVRRLTLGIPPAQCTALLGQNGAGKSTTFSMLTGEIRPTSGEIYLNEKKANSRQLCRGLISYCPQSDAIDPLLTVREILAFYCRLRGITDKDEVIKRTIDMFDLRKYAAVRSGALSGGNKRKLCAAIAFMGRTPLVLLDEPTSGMDPGSRGCVARGVRAACAAQRGVLLSTHALQDARRLCARIALVRAARLAALAPLDLCLRRFGGGYVVACRVCRGGAREAWRRVRRAAPHARLRLLHHAALHFLLPTHALVNQKEVTTNLSDIFRLMAELQGACDIEDYTVNQSSLDQMFLSFTEKGDEDSEPVELEALPVPAESDELSTVTTL